ncbi:MAG: hypothetical protein JWM80_5404 [Cyanobacteria bacterium RYN_339]|nr:hypothetical protein [Cyanobacteria bacterium RYN_339]
MPVTAIPFRSPPPYELPPHVVESLRQLDAPAAAVQVLELLRQLDAADAQLVAFGRDELEPGPALGDHEGLTQALEQLRSPGPSTDFLRQAIAQGGPLLMMGELEAAEPAPFPPAFAGYLLGGAERANVGFLYVFPLMDAQGAAHGALALHRTLTAGPLNHDQPAIAQALVTELAARAAANT